MKTLAFANQKGGVGKTTSCLSVGAALAEQGFRVLMIDADPQGNLTVAAGIDLQDGDQTLYEVLKDPKTPLSGCIRSCGTYDILPADIALSGVEIEFASVIGREQIMKEILEPVIESYDYILIDCPPSLSLITIMGLTAADGVIVPVQAHYLALQGIKQLTDTIHVIRRRMNPSLEILGIVVTQFGRSRLNKEVSEALYQAFDGKVFKTKITNNIALAEAPSHGKDILNYKPRNKGADQYRELAQEIIERTK